MNKNYVPEVPAVKRMSRHSHTWTILTFAKVLRGPFTREDISSISPQKYPLYSRNVRDTLTQLVKMGLVDQVEKNRYHITQEGINTVYWFGSHFARTADKSDLGD